jgi:hypothetical protein
LIAALKYSRCGSVVLDDMGCGHDDTDTLATDRDKRTAPAIPPSPYLDCTLAARSLNFAVRLNSRMARR